MIVRRVLLLLVVGSAAACAAAQPIELDRDNATVVARFERATTLSADGVSVFVLDSGSGAVTAVDEESRRATRHPLSDLAGRPVEAAVDMDGTNGLRILLLRSDGTVVRYSHELVAVETIELDTGDRTAVGAFAPVAIAGTDERTMFVVDGGSGGLWRWRRGRGVDRVNDGALSASDVAAGPKNVFVYDRASDCVLVFDAFGTYDGSILCDPEARFRSVIVVLDRLFVTRSKGTTVTLDITTSRGEPVQSYRFPDAAAEPLAAYASRTGAWVLEERALLFFPAAPQR